MKTASKLFVLIALIVIAIIVVACASPTPEPTKATVPTSAPAPTKASEPTKAPEPTKAAAAPSSASAATTAPVPTTAPAAAPTATPIVVTGKCDVPAPSKATTIAYLGNKFGIMEYFAAALKACESVQNLKVNLDWLPSNDKDTKANLILSGGDKSPYDIIQGTNRNLAEWASQGWAMPLDDLIAKYKTQYKLEDIPAQMWQVSSFNGKVYGFPIDQNMEVLFYRKDILDKYNMKPPTTWDEAIAMFKTLKDKGDTPYQFAATYGKGSDVAGAFSNMLFSNGGEFYDGDKAIFNGPKGVEAVNKMKELMQFAPPDILTYNNDKVMLALQQGQVAMAITYITRAARMDDPSQSKFVGKIEYAPAPSFTKGGIPAGVWAHDFYIIPAKINNDPDIVFRAILEATTVDRQKGGMLYGMVTRASVASDPDLIKANRYMPAVSEAIKLGARIPSPKPYYSLTVAQTGDYVNQALAGTMPVQAALDTAVKEFTTQAKDKGFIK